MEDFQDFEDLIRRVEADDCQVVQDSLKEDRCQECGGQLIERDGLYYCDMCQVQAQDVKYTVEAECNFDEDGNFIQTQRIAQEKTDPKSLVDYGSPWTTSQAYSLILREQVEILKRNQARILVSAKYYVQVQELWSSYFKRFLMYPEMPRERDLSIMKGCIKVDIPPKSKRISSNKSLCYHFGNHSLNKPRSNTDNEDPDTVSVFEPITELIIDEEKSKFEDTHMTLGKTLGFLEAIARLRCNLIFASDLARWADQGVLPYHDSMSYFPADWKLNHKDRLMFSQTVSPKPTFITRIAANLLNVLCDSFQLPIPDPRDILRRMLMDMNMPCTDHGLVDVVLDTVTFDDLKMKLSVKLGSKKKRVQTIPQYDRWAAAMIIITLKRHFIFDGSYENCISSVASSHNKENFTNAFVFRDWFEQSYTRFRLIEQYDVGHFNQNLEKMESSTFCRFFASEANKWFNVATTRTPGTYRSKNDVNRQRDLKHFLMSAIPLPVEKNTTHMWERPNPSLTPLTDAYDRVRDMAKKIFPDLSLEKDFKTSTMKFYTHNEKKNDFCTIRDERQWSLGTQRKGVPIKTADDWPVTFKHLLRISSYLCYCDPQEILRELLSVEKIVALKTLTKDKRGRVKNAPRV